MTIQSQATWSPQVSWSPPASPNMSGWAEYWYSISWAGLLAAGAVTALGACAAIFFLMLQWRAASIRDSQVEWRASVLEMQAAQARKDTAEALERVASLNIEAARMKRKNLSLAELVQPRQLSGEQAHDVVAALAPYSGRSVTLWSYGFDLEGGALAEQIRQSLIEAHVIVVNNIGQLNANERTRIGVQIAGADKELVGSLYQGLHSVSGLDAAVGQPAEAKAADEAPAEIFIGVKPLAHQPDVANRNDRAIFDDRTALAALPAH
jgi:hypothetical protein